MTDVVAQIALVTGASSGIGAAVAQALAAEGFQLVLCGRDTATLDRLASTLGTPSVAHPLDVSEPASVDSVLARLPEASRSVSVLVNSAGHDVGGRRFFDEGGAADWVAIIEANLVGLIRLTRVVCHPMIARGSGDIVNIGSLSALRPAARMAAYATSKAGVHMFSDVLRADLGRHGIRVTEILPGLTRTGFARSRLRGDATAATQFYDKAAGSLSGADVARAVIYALAQPLNVTVAQMVVVPSGQW